MPTPDIPPPSSSEPCVAPEEYFSATYQAIGRFLVGCADAQTGIAWKLDVCIQKRLFKKRFSAEAMHVLAALSGETGMEKLRNLAKVIAIRLGSDKADVALIDSASIHIKHLQEFRNRIAHHGAYPLAYDGRWCIQTSNKLTSLITTIGRFGDTPLKRLKLPQTTASRLCRGYHMLSSPKIAICFQEAR